MCYYISQWTKHGLFETRYIFCCSVKYILWNYRTPRSSKNLRNTQLIIPRQPNCGSHEPWEVIFSHQIRFWEVIYKIFHKYLSGFVTQHSLAEILGVCLAEWSQYCNKNVEIVLSIHSLANEEQLRAFYDFAGCGLMFCFVYMPTSL